MISLGHSAFFGIGMYTTAILVVDYGWSQGWTFYAARGGRVRRRVPGGAAALRLKGVYLALVTLALAVLFPMLVKWDKLEWLTERTGRHRRRRLRGHPVVAAARRAARPRGPGEVRLLAGHRPARADLATSSAGGIVKSRVGRSLIAIRDNETAAAVMGVHLARTKTIVFGISAAMCALGGSLPAIRRNLGQPDIADDHPRREHHVPPDHGPRRRGDPVGADRRRARSTWSSTTRTREAGARARGSSTGCSTTGSTSRLAGHVRSSPS